MGDIGSGFSSIGFPGQLPDGSGIGAPPQEEEGLPTISIVQIVFFLIICIFGLLANLFVMFIIVVLQEFKKSVTHWYVLQLAIADSIFLLTLPFQVSEELSDAWIYPVWMCKGKDTILFINYYASIMFLMVMSIDRYIAVCHSFSDRLQKIRTQKSSFIITICVWIIAILLTIPVMLYSSTTGTEPNCRCTTIFPAVRNVTEECIMEDLPPEECDHIDPTVTCNSFPQQDGSGSGSGSGDGGGFGGFGGIGGGRFSIEEILKQIAEETAADNSTGNQPNETLDLSDTIAPECHYFNQPPGWRNFLAFNFSVMFLLPFLVMTVCYGLILRKLGTTKMIQTNQEAKSRQDSERRRITRMCATLVFTFALCWCPFHAVHLAKIKGVTTSNGMGEPCVIATTVTTLLAYLNSALNPYLYTFLGTGFARRFKSLKSAPVMKPVMAMSVMKKKSKGKKKTEERGQEIRSSEETGRSSNDHRLSNTQSAPTLVTKAIVSKVSENQLTSISTEQE